MWLAHISKQRAKFGAVRWKAVPAEASQKCRTHPKMSNTPKNVEHDNHEKEGAHPTNARTHMAKFGQNTETQVLAKCGLAECGHDFLNSFDGIQDFWIVWLSFRS